LVLEKGVDFVPEKTQEERDEERSKVITVRLTRDELEQLEEDGKFLHQEKLSTVIKTLVRLGRFVIQQPQSAMLIEVLFKNDERNKRRGIVEVQPNFKRL